MKRYILIHLIGTFLLLYMQKIDAQAVLKNDTLSLEQLWQQATSNNRQLKLSDLELQQSNLEILEAKDHQLPELSIGGDLRHNSKFLIYENGLFSSPQNVPIKDYGYTAGYNLTFNLFSGGKEKTNIKIKKEQNLHSQYEIDLIKHNVKYNVAIVYFDLYKFLHFRDFLDSEIVSQKKQLSLIESLHRNGIVLKSDVLRTSVKLSQLELSRSELEKKMDITKLRLNVLSGREMEDNLSIYYNQDSMEEFINDSSYQDYMDIALNHSSEFKLVKSDIKLSEMNIHQIKSTLLPKISLYSNYNYSYPQLSFYPYSNNLWGFGQTGIKLQYSIDNIYKSKHTLAHAHIEKKQAIEKGYIKKDQILLDVKDAYLQQLQASESVSVAEKNIVKTKETVRVIRSSYLNQESLLTDLLEAENALLEARFNLITEQTNLKLSHIRLLAIIGIL